MSLRGWFLLRLMNCKCAESSQRGAILLLLLVMVVILGLATGMAGQSWRSAIQRAREAELLWRGEQYQKAIASYYAVKHGPQQMFPAKLDDLLRDPRFPNVVRHLRKLYNDPMTGEDWELVTDPAERIIGVHSKSTLQPFKTDGFSKELESLKGKTSYQEWAFVYKPPTASRRTGQAVSQPPGSGSSLPVTPGQPFGGGQDTIQMPAARTPLEGGRPPLRMPGARRPSP
jgi:type II secretory pathway pseudopilin PulG